MRSGGLIVAAIAAIIVLGGGAVVMGRSKAASGGSRAGAADAVLVQNAAVLQQIRGATVFVVANGKASQRVVKVGATGTVQP